MSNNIRLAWLFPSTLYLHGERGNILALEKLARDKDLNLEIDQIELDNKFSPLDYDIIYLSAGENIQAESVINNLKKVKNELETFINQGRPLLVTGNTINFFGKKIIRADNSEIEGLGLLDVLSKEKKDVYGDDLNFIANYNNQELEILGNQIQVTDLVLGKEKPFGKILYGYGNNGTDINEGVQRNNSIFTNTLGPLLVLNPWLAKEILKVALENKNQIKDLKTDFSLENQSLQAKKNYIKNKKTNLKNAK